MLDLASQLRTALLPLHDLLNGCMVYLDAGASEVLLQTGLSLTQFRELGAVLVCALEGEEGQSAERHAQAFKLLAGRVPSKLVFFTTRQLTDAHSRVLGLLAEHKAVTSCTLLSALSEDTHASQRGSLMGAAAYSRYADALREDLKDRRLGEDAPPPRIEVRYFPLSYCALDSASFVLPAATPAVQAELGGALPGFNSTAFWDLGELGLENPKAASLKLIAHQLAALAGQLHLRPDVFTVGPLSNALGAELSTLPPPPPSHQGGEAGVPQPATFVLLDRSLDLVTPSAHTEHTLDRVLAGLPRRRQGSRGAAGDVSQQQRRGCDVAIPLCESGVREEEAASDAVTTTMEVEPVSGSLLQGGEARSREWREALALRPARDTLPLIRKWLKEALRSSGGQVSLKISRPGVVSPEELSSLAAALTATPGGFLRHKALLQLAWGAAAALKGPHAARHAQLAAQEKQLQLISSEGAEGLAGEVVALFSVASKARLLEDLKLEDALLLAATAYSLAGEAVVQQGELGSTARSAPPLNVARRSPFSVSQEASMQKALVDAILAAKLPLHDVPFLGELKGRLMEEQRQRDSSGEGEGERRTLDRGLRLEVEDKVDEVLAKLHTLSRERQPLRELRRLQQHGVGSAQRPLLCQLAARLADRAPLSDLVHHTASLRGLLTSGLGRMGFGLGAKAPHPGDAPTVVVFVVGGISLAEVREVRLELGEREASRQEVSKKLPHFILGGTALLSPQDVYQNLFA